MSRVQQTQSDLEKQLSEQFGFLIDYADQYDAGKTHYAKQMATVLRILLHDTRKSHSLFGQLGLKQARYFYDTARDPHDAERQPGFDYRNTHRTGSFTGIIGLMFPPLRLVPYLDTQGNRQLFGFVTFDEYWNRVILIDADQTDYTRADIVSAVVDTDGGAHVDPSLEEKYYRLTRSCNLGIVAVKDKTAIPEITNKVALACVRQIAHEVIRTFCIDYPQREQIVPKGPAVFSMDAIAKRKQPTDDLPPLSPYKRFKPGRNDTCPCRSNEKYKKCHGKHFECY